MKICCSDPTDPILHTNKLKKKKKSFYIAVCFKTGLGFLTSFVFCHHRLDNFDTQHSLNSLTHQHGLKYATKAILNYWILFCAGPTDSLYAWPRKIMRMDHVSQGRIKALISWIMVEKQPSKNWNTRVIFSVSLH